MTTRIIGGPLTKELDRDERGHRTYKVRFRIEGDPTPTIADGPTNVLLTPGLPVPGTPWLLDADTDVFAWCLPTVHIEPDKQLNNDPVALWTAEYTFTTKTADRDPTNPQQEDPTSEPDIVSGDFIRYVEEGIVDRFGRRIQSSSMEPLRGAQNEWEEFRATISVKQVRPILEIDLWYPMIGTLNDAALWGFPARFIRLTPKPWTEKWHKYSKVYERNFNFEVWAVKETDDDGAPTGDIVSGWDRKLVDIGTRVLRGDWVNGVWVLKRINGQNPNPSNPLHFQRYQEANGNLTTVLLDGGGKPLVVDTPTVAVCAQCNPAPAVWIVSGFSPEFSDFNGIRLASTGGCNWSKSVTTPFGTNTVTLSYSPGPPTQWYITVSGVDFNPAWLFTTPAASWSCLGSNSMAPSGINPPSGQTTLSVYPQGGSNVVLIPVEKYTESNFLLLGIPAVIGP